MHVSAARGSYSLPIFWLISSESLFDSKGRSIGSVRGHRIHYISYRTVEHSYYVATAYLLQYKNKDTALSSAILRKTTANVLL